jgi:hypothetical protein
MFAACFLLLLPFNHEDVDDMSSEVSGFLRTKRPFIPESLTLQYMCIANDTLCTREREREREREKREREKRERKEEAI